jgi:hypothetical protein
MIQGRSPAIHGDANVPTEFTSPDNNGHDDLRQVAYLPQHVRGLQSEVTGVFNECMQELEFVCEMLRGIEIPATATGASPRNVPMPSHPKHDPGNAAAAHAPSTALDGREAPHPSRAATLPPAATERPTYAKTESTTDFDARLANLKRLLAEKLTEDEPTKDEG